MDISLIQKKYNNHQIAFEDIKQAFEKAKIEIPFPISHQVLANLYWRISYIFESILDAAKKDNLYSAFILYRSLLEHFFKGMFLIDKMVATMSDAVAENYQKHYFISEFLAEQSGVLEMEDLTKNQTKTDFIKFLTSKYPEIIGFDKSNQQEISAALKQFNLKDIIKYLYLKAKNRAGPAGNEFIIAQTLPEYSRVSTFTHGGPYASVLMDKYINQNDIENQMTKIILISLTSTCVSKENFFLTYRIDESFNKYILHLQSLRA
jgi:hypothetical protein